MVNRSPYVTSPASSPARIDPVLTNASCVFAKSRCESATRSPAGDSPAGVEPPSRWDGMSAEAWVITFWVTGFVAVTAASTTAWTRGSGVTVGAPRGMAFGGGVVHGGGTQPHAAAH